MVPKGKRSYPLGVQQWFFVLFSLPKLVRALLNQRSTTFTSTLSGSSSGRDADVRLRLVLWNQVHEFNSAGFCSQLFVGHQDTSLENLLLSRGVAKVMVFGMACQTSPENLALR